MASGTALQRDVADWCKKECLRLSHTLLLKTDVILTDSTEDILIALAKIFQHLLGVSRRERNDTTQLLCEFEKDVSDVVLPFSGEVTLKLSSGQTTLKIQRLGVVVKSRVRVQDLVDKGLIPSEKKLGNQMGEALARVRLKQQPKITAIL